MDHDENNPYDPSAQPITDEQSEYGPRTRCETYAQELLERAAERRRELARDHPDEKRHLEAAVELSRLAVEVRGLARSPLEETFETAQFFIDDCCEKTHVLAIEKENELVRSIGFRGHCATGVDFMATVIGFWLDAALECVVEPDLETPRDVADAAAVDRYITLKREERDLRCSAHHCALTARQAQDLRAVDCELAELSPTITPEDRQTADDWLQWLADVEWGKAL
jgi:hypothetical protein